jgi:hypothetical protein
MGMTQESPGAHGTDGGQMLREMHQSMLWCHFLNMMLGMWLLSSPFVLGYLNFDATALDLARLADERDLPPIEWRNLAMLWSDIVSGALIMLFAGLSALPSRRFPWAQWATAVVGLWLLFAPLVFWAPSPGAYANSTLIGALVIGLAVLVPMMPGMSMEGMNQPGIVPPGWDYSPSTWMQRAPIAALGLIGLVLARYLAGYQMGHTSAAWDPFFGTGTEDIITSDVSRAWPVADAGLGATTYMLEILMALMGDARRWRTMPWMVVAFGIVVIPLGAVSVVFIIIQPIVIGTWCTLCLVQALAMVIMIPYAIDEVVAMGQYLAWSRRAGRPFWRTFWMGGAMPGAEGEKPAEFAGSPRAVLFKMARGVSLPWTLFASVLVGVWLMFTRLVYGTEGAMADSDHLVGALVITVAIIAMAEVVRALRFVNVGFGLWLIAAPWLLGGATLTAGVGSVVAGVVLVLLSLPRGPVRDRYAGWDRYIV